MSVHRFLSKREKHRDGSKRLSSSTTANSDQLAGIDPTSAQDFYGLFLDSGKPTSAEESKIKSVRQYIVTAKSILLKDSQILWALRSNFSKGNADEAQSLLIAFSDAAEGIMISYNPKIRLLGAVNRQAVTCYLDATLFAMFSRLDSFEAMLYNSFDDLPRNRLGFLLRIWVNLLRAGKLITTDITLHIQDALAECGWKDAAKLRQQDASEAFTFITEVLRLPLLTLKMDMFHAGKQDADDHRFINERLLEVGIPSNENGDQKDIKLEDCLEEYFNNRIEVRRFLERRSTVGSTRSFDSSFKQGAIHVETTEVDADMSPLTPMASSPITLTSSRPTMLGRSPSIIQERFVPGKDGDIATQPSSPKQSVGRLRKGSVRKEVLMPAWQFFSLIPWYTDNAPSSDAQVAAHFSSKRPVLGLCLKRYSMLPNGKAIRLNTHIDVPVEIGLPHFIQDDHMDDTGPIFGNFKLSLQSMVCHRGNSVDSGHYIALVRGTPTPGSESNAAHWMRFDDLASERITLIDIHQALREETPYLLFYQIMPIDGDPGNLTAGENPPSYEVSQAESAISGGSASPDLRETGIASDPPSGRPSLETPPLDVTRGRTSAGDRRPSAISFSEHLPMPGRAGNDVGDSIGRQSRSLSRTTSVLGKTLSNLTSPRSKEIPVDPDVKVSVANADSEGTSSSQDAVTAQNLASKLTRKEKDKEKDKGKSKLGKSRSRHRSEHPDRECMVM